ncbi:unnamed protein product [Caenorhabditis nigoni]
MESPTEVILDYSNPLNATVACLTLVIGVFGVFCNSSIVYIFYKEKSERSSFNLICVFRSLSNIYILGTTFLGLFLPKTILGFSPYPPALESTLIHISNTLYLGNEYQIILVAVNRFIAMFLPVHYNKLCGFKSTLLILVVIYLVRIVIVIFETYEQLKINCHTSFLLVALAWRYDSQEQCQFEDNILVVISITFAIMTAINGATLLKIISFYKSSKNESNENKKRIRRNVFLFFQTGLQDSLYLIDLSFMMKFSYLSEARVWSYISGTFVWEYNI